MNLSVTIDAREFTKSLGEFASQAPFILQKAINQTLVDTQKDMLSAVNDRFTIRRQAFARQSFKITKFATKQDLEGTLAVAPVGKNPVSLFAKFEDGDRKTANGGKVAVPTTYIRPDASRVITTAKRPRNLTNSFKITTARGTDLILQTKGKGKRAKTSVAYVLKQSVATPRKLGFEQRTTAYINTHLEQNLASWTEKALHTARLK